MTTEEIIKNYYVTENDYYKIKDYTNTKHYGLTFRKAGEHTLARLSAGAGAKPHDIIEKTIKTDGKIDSIEYAEYISKLTPAISSRLAKIAYEALKGFVGHWEDNKLIGIYLTDWGREEIIKKDTQMLKCIYRIKTSPSTTRYYLKITSEECDGKYMFNKLTYMLGPSWETYFFTGDYDLHDSLHKAGHWCYMIESAKGSSTKTIFDKFKDEINNELRVASEVTNIQDYDRIQHGPQFNYIAYMLNNETLKSMKSVNKNEMASIIRSVASAQFPIAICIEGIWNIINDMNEYKRFIEGLGLTVKHLWENDEAMNKFLLRVQETFKDQIKVIF